MRTMGILAVLVGTLETLNSLFEAFAGGFVGRAGVAELALILAVLAPVLLLASGVALLARTRGATTLACGAALMCLVVFAAIAMLQPMFSLVATVLGVGFPVVLLFSFYWNSQGGRSASLAL